jgi:hypothetical protein
MALDYSMVKRRAPESQLGAYLKKGAGHAPISTASLGGLISTASLGGFHPRQHLWHNSRRLCCSGLGQRRLLSRFSSKKWRLTSSKSEHGMPDHRSYGKGSAFEEKCGCRCYTADRSREHIGPCPCFWFVRRSKHFLRNLQPGGRDCHRVNWGFGARLRRSDRTRATSASGAQVMAMYLRKRAGAGCSPAAFAFGRKAKEWIARCLRADGPMRSVFEIACSGHLWAEASRKAVEHLVKTFDPQHFTGTELASSRIRRQRIILRGSCARLMYHRATCRLRAGATWTLPVLPLLANFRLNAQMSARLKVELLKFQLEINPISQRLGALRLPPLLGYNAATERVSRGRSSL